MKKWKNKISIFVIGLLLATISFVTLLWVERQSLKDYDQTMVVRCVQRCLAGEEITAQNVNKYFETQEVPASLATAGTFASPEELIGFYPERTIEPGEIIYSSVLNVESALEQLKNPVEISISAEVENAVAGRIRKGDVVNVYVENSSTKKYELILEQVVVQKAYDLNATEISMSNESALAIMFTFCVEDTVAKELSSLYTGNVAILKVR